MARKRRPKHETVVVCVVVPDEFDEAAQRYATFEWLDPASYYQAVQTRLDHLLETGCRVEIAGLSPMEFEEWCTKKALDPDSSNARAQWAEAKRTTRYLYEGSLRDVLDYIRLVALGRTLLEDLGNDRLVEDLSCALVDLQDSLGSDTPGTGVLHFTLATSSTATTGELQRSFLARCDAEGFSCISPSEDLVVAGMAACGLLAGGEMTWRVVSGDREATGRPICTVSGYAFSGKGAAWRRLGAEELNAAYAGLL